MKPLLLGIFMFIYTCGQSQTVGVVLSGGGAKGIAHIGVLKVLEENNIPIDYIAGTSMGAIVAALYASGYSPDEIIGILGSKEFEEWGNGIIDSQHQFYYKAKDESPQWISLEFIKTNNGFKALIPTSLISPSQMDLRFMQFYGPPAAVANYDFKNLMIPFFCVATDVHNNKPVYLKSGNLASAVRASMTFPGFYKPIMIDSTLLFDGGMENNFPVDEMISQFNPDIIIGSKVANNPKKPDADDLYQQLENVFMKNTDYSMPENGILIEPKVEQFGMLDFYQSDSLFNEGTKATELKISEIKNKITRRQSADIKNNMRYNFKRNIKPIVFQNIYISGVEPSLVDYVLKNIKRNRDTLSFNEFQIEYFKLLSDKLISSIYPSMVYNNQSGYYDLYLDVRTKNSIVLSTGGNLSTNLSSMAYIGLEYIFHKKIAYNLGANMYIGRSYNSLMGKMRMDFPPRTPQKDKMISPFYITMEAIYNSWDYFNLTSHWTIDSDAPTDIWQREMHFDATIGRPVQNNSILSTGFSYGKTIDNYYHTNTIEKKDSYDETNFTYSALHIEYENSSLNYKQYANMGRLIKLKLQYITGNEDYTPGTTALPYDPDTIISAHTWFNIKLSYRGYILPKHKFKLGYAFDLNYSNKSGFSNSMSSLLQAPDFSPFPQSQTIFVKDFRAYTWMGIGVIPILSITEKIDFRTEAYLFQPYQDILTSTYLPSFSNPLPKPRIMASSAFIYHSPIGPIALTGSYFMNEENPFYIQINMGFILFNMKGHD